jgi:hypothetical protein
MAKIVYTDHEKAAPYVRFHGVEFTHGQEVEIGEEAAELIGMARLNPYFAVTQEGVATQEPAAREAESTALPGQETPEGKGRLAAMSGKPRNVPLSYRGKAQEALWLKGYDAASKPLG